MTKYNRTTNQLEENINNSFSWRRKELSIYKTNLQKAEGKWKEALLRAGVPLIYAHWEGFVKEIAEFYLEHVSLQSLKHIDLKSTFIALCVRSQYDSLESNKHSKRSNSIEFLLNELDKRSQITVKKQIYTASN